MSEGISNPKKQELDHGQIIASYKHLYSAKRRSPSKQEVATHLRVPISVLSNTMTAWGISFNEELKFLAFPGGLLPKAPKVSAPSSLSLEDIESAAASLSETDRAINYATIGRTLKISFSQSQALLDKYDVSLFSLRARFQPQIYGEDLFGWNGHAILLSPHAKIRFKERFDLDDPHEFMEQALQSEDLVELIKSKDRDRKEKSRHGHKSRQLISKQLDLVLVLSDDLSTIYTVYTLSSTSALSQVSYLRCKKVSFPKIY